MPPANKFDGFNYSGEPETGRPGSRTATVNPDVDAYLKCTSEGWHHPRQLPGTIPADAGPRLVLPAAPREIVGPTQKPGIFDPRGPERYIPPRVVPVNPRIIPPVNERIIPVNPRIIPPVNERIIPVNPRVVPNNPRLVLPPCPGPRYPEQIPTPPCPMPGYPYGPETIGPTDPDAVIDPRYPVNPRLDPRFVNPGCEPQFPVNPQFDPRFPVDQRLDPRFINPGCDPRFPVDQRFINPGCDPRFPVDSRFINPGCDPRFPVDSRFINPGCDPRFPVDTRFINPGYDPGFPSPNRPRLDIRLPGGCYPGGGGIGLNLGNIGIRIPIGGGGFNPGGFIPGGFNPGQYRPRPGGFNPGGGCNQTRLGSGGDAFRQYDKHHYQRNVPSRNNCHR